MSLAPVSQEILFRGRPGDPRLGEWVKLTAKLPQQQTSRKEAIAIVGFPDDEGVTRNHGRAGARGGPDGIRKHFYKLCPPMDFEWEETIELYDAGNIYTGGDIEATHQDAEEATKGLAAVGATVITLGGGHDFAAPAFLGFKAGYTTAFPKTKKVSLINVDPHLDVRPLEANLPHSGTPFRVILEKKASHALSAFGIRRNRNARAHYQFAKDHGVRVFTLEALRGESKSMEHLFRSELSHVAKGCEVMGVTIDLDSCREAEGTSAAPVLGFSAQELCHFATLAGREKKVKWLDLAEAAPSLDTADRICRIASEIIFHFLLARAEIGTKKRG